MKITTMTSLKTLCTDLGMEVARAALQPGRQSKARLILLLDETVQHWPVCCLRTSDTVTDLEKWGQAEVLKL